MRRSHERSRGVRKMRFTAISTSMNILKLVRNKATALRSPHDPRETRPMILRRTQPISGPATPLRVLSTKPSRRWLNCSRPRTDLTNANATAKKGINDKSVENARLDATNGISASRRRLRAERKAVGMRSLSSARNAP